MTSIKGLFLRNHQGNVAEPRVEAPPVPAFLAMERSERGQNRLFSTAEVEGEDRGADLFRGREATPSFGHIAVRGTSSLRSGSWHVPEATRAEGEDRETPGALSGIAAPPQEPSTRELKSVSKEEIRREKELLNEGVARRKQKEEEEARAQGIEAKRLQAKHALERFKRSEDMRQLDNPYDYPYDGTYDIDAGEPDEGGVREFMDDEKAESWPETLVH